MRGAQLICRCLYYSHLVLDKTLQSPFRARCCLEGFTEEVGLKLGLEGKVHVIRN